MPEGAAVGGKVVAGAVHDDPEKPPAPGPAAPKGWTWNRADRNWQPKRRGPVVWEPAGENAVAAPPGGFGWFGKDGQPPDTEASPPGETPADGYDPAPGWLADGAGEQPAARVKPGDVPKQVRDDVASFAGLVGMPILALVKTVDPYCGGVLADGFEDIVDAALPLVCRSPKVVKFFTSEDSDWMLWLKLAMVMGPMAKAIADHHVFGTVKVVRDEQTGQVSIVRGREAVAAAERGDPLQPRAQPDMSQYAA